jgi:hypothetical protein
VQHSQIQKDKTVPSHPPRSLLALKNIQLREAQEQANVNYKLVLENHSSIQAVS